MILAPVGNAFGVEEICDTQEQMVVIANRASVQGGLGSLDGLCPYCLNGRNQTSLPFKERPPRLE